MTLFNNNRLTNAVFKLDHERMRDGWYSDKYFANILAMLEGTSQNGRFFGQHAREIDFPIDQLNIGNLEVEVQIFTRHAGQTVIVGVDKSLSMLRHCTGFRNDDGAWEESWQNLTVEAVHDGAITSYYGDPRRVQPVIRVRGRYRDFALLETPILGVLSRSSRIATNVYEVLRAARGKQVLFFPARFDLHEVQAADGYAYEVAIERYNRDFGEKVNAMVSTDAQGDWWGGLGGGTIAHAAIACFLSDTSAAMLAFAEFTPIDVPRIALVDFNNDCVTDSLRTAAAMFKKYAKLHLEGDKKEAKKFILNGVRLDTSGSLRDVSVPPLGDPGLDLGVTPRLVFKVREALDNAWESWVLSDEEKRLAKDYCQNIRIVVTGGFNADKIARFEKLGVPADVYGVGSSLFTNGKGTNCDFTADIVRIKAGDTWFDMAKVGRAPSDNSDLQTVDLTNL